MTLSSTPERNNMSKMAAASGAADTTTMATTFIVRREGYPGIPSELRKRRSSSTPRNRRDSEGSTIGAFYAKPFVVPPRSRKKRHVESLKNNIEAPITNDDAEIMDFSSAVNLAIEQEGGQDRVADLVWHPLEFSVENVGQMDETKVVEGLPKYSQNNVSHPPLFVYGTMPDQVERSTADAIRFERQNSTNQEDSVLSGSGGDRFFTEEGPFNFRTTAGLVSHDGALDSLRYSEYSVDTGTDTRNSSILGSIFLNLQKSFSFVSNKGNTTSTATHDGQGFFETRRRKKPGIFYGRLQESIDENTPEYVWPPIAKQEFMVHTRPHKQSMLENLYSTVTRLLDPIPWLEADAIFPPSGEEGRVRFPEDNGHRTVRGLARTFLFNPAYPEFTSLQQFVWSIIIGVAMGFYTAAWKYLIAGCVEFNWVVVPAFLKQIGFFTDRDGRFPMMHYMWICPTVVGSILSYIFAVLPKKIPTQNQWIQNIHSKGVQDCDTFWQLFFLSTMGMASGLSLGPELPLVLTAGMAGSYLGTVTRQSVLQARVLNLVAASAAVGGFFGFPMASAIFVLEMPHRMGLQYFEALSPAIFGSIVAVLTNRMVVNNDVTGYFNYPFLTDRLPSTIFWHAIIFGVYGAAVGIGYAKGVLKFKDWVHDLFHAPAESIASVQDKNRSVSVTKPVDEEYGFSREQEFTPLVIHKNHSSPTKRSRAFDRLCLFVNQFQTLNIRQEPRRAAVAGAIAGFLVGITGMFVPHSLFWGEAQLQNLIDKGRSPLPIFGRGDDPTADLTAWAFCLLDPDNDRNRYSLGCSALICVSKIFATGLSLGTGIIGGHFWGPLFTGCIASHFFTDLADMVGKHFGVNPIVGTYPCVAILCTMGASHVVTFRAHTSIMLILTLTISAFTPEDATAGFAAGNYSAVFPLLVVAVYVSLMISRDFVKFYPAQRCRGDIMALPEALCEPGKAGAPMFTYYSDDEDESYITGSHSGSSDAEDSDELSNEGGNEDRGKIQSRTNAFESIDHVDNDANKADTLNVPKQETDHVDLYGDNKTEFPTGMSSSRLDRLLSAPLPERVPIKAQQNHRRVRSACESQALAVDLAAPAPGHRRSRTTHSPGVHSPGSSSESGRDLGRVYSFGEILDFQPSLLDQARARASSRHHVSSRRARSHPKSPAHTHSPGRTVD